ncbi:MAG: Crp/Fnr family transcriptional regulator [Sandaracinaceae bacterium]|nr:Crp/Fnr family transcriptional regulator [Sandaracinaceae bacterium]
MHRVAAMSSIRVLGACPDCPACRLSVFTAILGAPQSACAFDVASIEARAQVPAGWSERYAFGMVRRGVLIRQRAEAGRATAVDAAGPGCVFPIEAEPSSDYAATDLLVCLMPKATYERAIETEPSFARDLLAMQQAALARVERITHARGAPTVRERVASLLCVLADTLTPPRRRERLPSGLQQRDLARLLGVRHETFCRILGDLEREGAIRRDTDGIAIVDRDGLERAA